MTLRAGRLALAERYEILEYIGKEANRRYLRNLKATGYKGTKFKKAFHFEPDPVAFDNHYYLETDSEELNRILQYLEYGTGLYGKRKRAITSKKTSPKTHQQLLLKFKYEGQMVFTRQVKGVKPGFMFTKAVESVRNEFKMLMRIARAELRI